MGRRDSDEDYVLDLCDQVLGELGLRQHRFEWLEGDRGSSGRAAKLPVDAYWPVANLVVEYRERQHDQPVAFFDKPDRLTVSGVHRGIKRARYDARRDEHIPAHGIRLVIIKPEDLDSTPRGRLRRSPSSDAHVIRRLLRAEESSSSAGAPPGPAGQEPVGLRFLIPPTSENRWTDLLATFIDTDPRPMKSLVGHEVDDVAREVLVRHAPGDRRGGGVRRADRLDLLLRRDGKDVVAIEAKLLAPFGPRQLERYEESFPGVTGYVLHLGRFPLVGSELRGWKPLTWEEVLQSYSESSHPWVAMTARAWLDRLGDLVPEVDAGTRWNDVPQDVTGFEVALRARMAWLHQEFSRSGHRVDHDLVVASNGGSWVLRCWLPAGDQGHCITAELSERLPSPAWKLNEARPFSDRVLGPQFLVGLRQDGVKSSASFDWDLLRRMFTDTVFRVTTDSEAQDGTIEIIDRREWTQRSAAPRSTVDRDNHAAMQRSGAPSWLGQGYGMAQAKSGGACVFGARFTLPPDIALHEVHEELSDTVQLLNDMSAAVR